MDRDLRDAVRALSLVRADLVATRQAKADAERQWRAHAAQQQRQLAELRETLAMREEDLRSAVSSPEKHQDQPDEDEASPEAEPEGPDAAPSREDVAKDQVALLASVYALQTQVQQQQAQLLAQDAQFAQDRGEWALLREASARQLAGLQEAQRDLVSEKKFMDEKFEFLRAEVDVVKRERDALREQLQQAAAAAVDEEESAATPPVAAALAELELLQREKQGLVAERDGLAASLEQLKESQRQAAEEQDAEMGRLRGELETQKAAEARRRKENEELTKQYEEERASTEAAWLAERQTLNDRIDELNGKLEERDVEFTELTHAVEQLRADLGGKQDEINTLVSDRTDLIQQLQQIRDHSTEQLRVHAKQEEERMKTQRGEQEKLQHDLTTLLASFEAATSENALKMSSLQCSNESLQRALAAKAVESEEAEDRARQALEKVNSLQLAVDLGRRGLADIRNQLQEQRQLISDHQGSFSINQLHSALVTRFNEELGKQRAHHKSIVAQMEKQLADSEVEQRRLESEVQHVQDAARTLREQLIAAEKQRDDQMQGDIQATEQLRATLQDREREVVRLTEVMESEKGKILSACEARLAELQVRHEEALGTAREDQSKLASEVEALKLAQQQLERELTLAREAVDQAEIKLKQTLDTSRSENTDVQRRLEALEQQLMAAEDDMCSVPSHPSWMTLPPHVRTLDEFLPQLQLFAGRLHTSLQLCAENSSALHVLSNSPSASPSLLSDISRLLYLAEQWKRVFDAQGLALHVRLVRRSVLATLSQWYEEGDEPSGSSTSLAPPPSFDIDSEEVAIVLQNWTSDHEKRLRVAQWLKQMATSKSRDGDDDDETTLELTDMTREVKDAFCVLIVPLLRQNRTISVRVFTRRVCDIKSSYSPDETCWNMRIHILARRPESGPLRRISSMSSVSSVGSTTSSIASSLSLSSISSASKLQIIQARLQQMQQR